MTREPSTHLSDYIWIPDTNIRIEGEQSFGGLANREACNALGRKRAYFMPSATQFMRFYNGVIAAEAGKIILYDGANKELSTRRINELYERFVLGKQGGVWTHLNDHYVAGSGHHGLDVETDYRVCHEGKNKKISLVQSPLEQCVEGDGILVNLRCNAQGLPTQQSGQEFIHGKNLYFWEPQKDCFAWFVAGSGRAYFFCDEDPQSSYASPGVLACAEGTPRRTR